MLLLLPTMWASWRKYDAIKAAAAAATSVGGNAPHSSRWGEYVWRAAIVDLRAGGAPPT